MFLCPECKAGKHGNCDGVAGISDYDDSELRCECREDGHTAARAEKVQNILFEHETKTGNI